MEGLCASTLTQPRIHMSQYHTLTSMPCGKRGHAWDGRHPISCAFKPPQGPCLSLKMRDRVEQQEHETGRFCLRVLPDHESSPDKLVKHLTRPHSRA